MTHKRQNHETFWLIIKANWTIEERAELRGYVEAWMSADKTVPR